MPSSVKHLKQAFEGSLPIVLFAPWPEDKLYYVVKLMKLDEKRGRCLVKYEDGHQCWVEKLDMHLQFHTSCFPYKESDDIFCCLCDSHESDRSNDIILCDVCQQGFHQQCHQPKIRQVDIDNNDEEWQCKTCSYILTQLDRVTTAPKSKSKSKQKAPKEVPRPEEPDLADEEEQEPEEPHSEPENVATEKFIQAVVDRAAPARKKEDLPIAEAPDLDRTEEGQEAGQPDVQTENVDTEKFIEAVVKRSALVRKRPTTSSKVPKKTTNKKGSKIPAPA